MFKPMTLAAVREVRATLPGDNPPLTYAEAIKHVTPSDGDPFLHNMARVLSMYSWDNSSDDWLRLEAALVVLAEHRQAGDQRALT
jgi:hypothetical protein